MKKFVNYTKEQRIAYYKSIYRDPKKPAKLRNFASNKVRELKYERPIPKAELKRLIAIANTPWVKNGEEN